MQGASSIDPGMNIDWGKTSEDYALFRPGPPPGFYDRLRILGVGLPTQRILDLGTGTGVLAREFARADARVSGLDISEGQIAMARHLAESSGLEIDFRVGPAEALPFPDSSFDAVTANQCWLYFDRTQTIPEVKRVLKPGGLLMISHFSWLPRLDPIARASEELVLQFNPQWTARDWAGNVPPFPRWAEGQFRLRAMFYYDEKIPFTRESWQGRLRACRGVGAALSAVDVEAFDRAHGELLERIAPPNFEILHRIDAHFLEPID